MWAMVFNQPAIVAQLLGAGADVNTRDNLGRTALILAVAFNRPAIVAQLLGARADVNAKDNKDQTALIMAVVSNQPAIVSQLLDAGADSNIKNDQGQTAWTLAANKPVIRYIIKDFSVIERKRVERIKQLIAADPTLPGDVARVIAEDEIRTIRD